jgi:hypothetical protein
LARPEARTARGRPGAEGRLEVDLAEDGDVEAGASLASVTAVVKFSLPRSFPPTIAWRTAFSTSRCAVKLTFFKNRLTAVATTSSVMAQP